jgi:hypothetical protein
MVHFQILKYRYYYKSKGRNGKDVPVFNLIPALTKLSEKKLKTSFRLAIL